MTWRFAVLAVVLLAACNNEMPATTDSTAARMPVAIEYVRADSLQVHARPSDDAAVVSTYANGESVSVLSRRGKWSEVRTATGSGWVHQSDLSSAAEAKQTESDDLTPRFKIAPQPVTQPGATGELVLEASVNSDGEVTNVRTLSNTTGSTSLERSNAASLRSARFYPIVRHGQRTPFTYEHHVHY